MQTAFNNADNNAIFILIFCENNLKIIATPKTFKIDTNKAVNIGTILFSLNIPSPILEHKRHNKVFKNKFIPKPEKKNKSCNKPLAIPIKTASYFPLIIE